MNNAGDSTHKPRAIDPQTFRALGNGSGQTAASALVSGRQRAQAVIDGAPKAQRAVANPSYPQPTGVYNPLTNRFHHPDTGVMLSPLPITLAGR